MIITRWCEFAGAVRAKYVSATMTWTAAAFLLGSAHSGLYDELIEVPPHCCWPQLVKADLCTANANKCSGHLIVGRANGTQMDNVWRSIEVA